MSKSSTVTVRETPVEAVARAKAGNLVIHGENFIIDTDERLELVDSDGRVMEYVWRFKISEGMITVSSMHTTCAIFINEFQKALLSDIRRFLEEMVARDTYYQHNDPDHSDCDRMNADSHLRAMLLGHSLTLQMSGGEVVLGQWQRILMAELDGPRSRTLRAQVWASRRRASGLGSRGSGGAGDRHTMRERIRAAGLSDIADRVEARERLDFADGEGGRPVRRARPAGGRLARQPRPRAPPRQPHLLQSQPAARGHQRLRGVVPVLRVRAARRPTNPARTPPRWSRCWTGCAPATGKRSPKSTW